MGPGPLFSVWRVNACVCPYWTRFYMARRPRLRTAGVPQHVIQRGNNRQATFFAEEDYGLYLDGQAIAFMPKAPRTNCLRHTSNSNDSAIPPRNDSGPIGRYSAASWIPTLLPKYVTPQTAAGPWAANASRIKSRRPCSAGRVLRRGEDRSRQINQQAD